jgi:hypothetical protein
MNAPAAKGSARMGVMFSAPTSAIVYAVDLNQ